MGLEPAMLGLFEGEGEGLKALVRSEPGNSSVAGLMLVWIQALASQALGPDVRASHLDAPRRQSRPGHPISATLTDWPETHDATRKGGVPLPRMACRVQTAWAATSASFPRMRRKNLPMSFRSNATSSWLAMPMLEYVPEMMPTSSTRRKF